MPATTAPWLTDDLLLLDDRCGLPLDRPFTTGEGRRLGLSRRIQDTLVARGLLREVVHGVYVAAQVRESIELRVAALRLVTDESAVVTDRTAAWLHGVDVLPRFAVYEPPPVQVFDRRGSRLRRPGVASGVRTLLDVDVVELGGVVVTTPLRTALDLGRLLRRYDAIAALDGFLRLGVPHQHLLGSVERFKGERGVIQLRELAGLADARAESPPESTLRLVWIDSGLPTPEPQCWVSDALGVLMFRIDVALPQLKFGAEYQGERFHVGLEVEARDEARRRWLHEHGWTIVPFWKQDLYGPDARPHALLRDGLTRARRRTGEWQPEGRYL